MSVTRREEEKNERTTFLITTKRKGKKKKEKSYEVQDRVLQQISNHEMLLLHMHEASRSKHVSHDQHILFLLFS